MECLAYSLNLTSDSQRRKKEFVVLVASGRDGGAAYPDITNQYILSASVEATNTLLIEAGQYGNLLHEEVWVFDQGYCT